jgi:hypothetical protein
MLVGLPLGAVRFKGHDWMKFQLADGREIGVSTTMDATHADDIVRKFLLTEKKVGHPFDPSDEPFNIDGVKVTYLENEDWQPVTPPWLHKQREWMWPLVALCLAAAAYLVMRSLGWVIDGFVRKLL